MSTIEKKIVRLVKRGKRYDDILYRLRAYCLADVMSAIKSLEDNLIIMGYDWIDEKCCYNPKYMLG